VSALYVHIPFCAQRCPYCDFAVSVDRRSDTREAYVQALCSELRRRLAGTTEPLQTVFFGGGTPTELPAASLAQILRVIQESAPLAADAEISLEANPEKLDEAYLATLRRAGWNRLSLGAQSFAPEDLQFLGRAHSPEDIAAVVARARRAGFSNLSLDLIYALPGQTTARWERTLQAAMALEVPHISAYGLTIEHGTEFGRRLRRGTLVPMPDDSQAEFMTLTRQALRAGGWEQYEVSNYARPGYACRHNQNYWRGGNYEAAGCGAHGHRDGHRWWNQRQTAAYIRGPVQAGEEFLTAPERLEERVALGMRTCEGIDLAEMGRALGLDARTLLRAGLEVAGSQGWITMEGDRVAPAPDKLPVADALAALILR
jgi:oxygen-independent coproporphyrinogen-3 oxidase